MRREKAESASPLALKLLIQFEQHISSQLLLLCYHVNRDWLVPGFDGRGSPKGFTRLYRAAYR